MAANWHRPQIEAELKRYQRQCAERGFAEDKSLVDRLQRLIAAKVSLPVQTSQHQCPPPLEPTRRVQKRSPKRSASDDGIVDRLRREIFDIEERTDLTIDEKVSQITHITCATCAGVAIQPIPFADILILSPIQAYMGSRIAAIRGVPVNESEASDVITEILGVIGMGFAAQQIAIGIWKTLIPGAGGFMTIPIVYGLSYAIMRVMDAYFEAKADRRKLTPEQIKAIWKNAKAEGERHGQSYRMDAKR